MTHEAFPQPPAENQDALLDNDLSQQVALQEVEVLARSLDMVPTRSDLGKYLAAPDKQFVEGHDGHSHLEKTGLSNYDAFKKDMAKAVDEFGQGKVARVSLMHGSVNGHIDAHKGSSIDNLRYAFEDLRHLSITGDSGFHTMLNPSGKTVGNLEFDKKDQVSDENSELLAKGAAAILEGQNTVMFGDYKGEPRTKMYGMTDPATGERLKNTFLLVGSGTFSDKEGTASNFSNLAWADVVLIPEDKLTQISEQATSEQKEVAISGETPAVEAFNIDNVDWEPFQHPTFKVKRTGGKFDEGGWNIKEITEDSGRHYAVITSWDKQRGGIQKEVPLEELIRWQNEEQ